MNSTFTKSLLVLAVGGLMIVGSASAQTSTTSGAGPGVVDPGHPRVNEVNKREANQQKRIGNGVANGKLTSQQTTNLEKRETSVQKREKKDMAEHNGHLTKAAQKGREIKTEEAAECCGFSLSAISVWAIFLASGCTSPPPGSDLWRVCDHRTASCSCLWR